MSRQNMIVQMDLRNSETDEIKSMMNTNNNFPCSRVAAKIKRTIMCLSLLDKLENCIPTSRTPQRSLGPSTHTWSSYEFQSRTVQTTTRTMCLNLEKCWSPPGTISFVKVNRQANRAADCLANIAFRKDLPCN